MRLTKQRPIDKVRGRPGTGSAPRWTGVVRMLPALVRMLPALVLLLAEPVGAQDPPPDVRWHELDGGAVRVVFHDGLEGVARRAAASANRALEQLEDFGQRPEDPIWIMVTDHMDLSNGFARSTPYPRIVIWARPPMGGPGSIPFADWIELLVTHEVVHVLHGEMTSPPGRLGRALLGRAALLWPLFPAYVLPSWAIEGVAVQAETAVGGEGRIHGTRLESMVRAAALEGSLERIDQVIGTSGVFPGGDRYYVYGGLFFEHLVQRFGIDAVGDWFRRSAERLNPYRLDATTRDVFGESLGTLYADWRRSVMVEARQRRTAVEARALAEEPELLTRGARMAVFPRVHPETGERVHALSDGGREPTLVTDEGRRIGPLHQVAAPSPLPGGGWLVPQPDYVDRYRIYNDLWMFAADGSRRVLTRGARVTWADVLPSNGRIVAVVEGGGTHRLVLLGPAGEELRVLAEPDPDRLWSQPRWSPDGTRIAVLRWRTGGIREIVLLDPEGRERGVVTRESAPMTGPTWSPDGRWIVWTSERSGVSNLYAAALLERENDAAAGEDRTGRVRQLSDLVTDAAFPDVDPDGRHVLFSLVRAGGWDLARLPFRPEEGFDPLPPDPRFERPNATEGDGSGAAKVPVPEATPWSPLSTLRPRHVLPFAMAGESLRNAEGTLVRAVSPVLGLSTSATDVVGRHGWELRVGAPVGIGIARWELLGRWRYAGLGNPVLDAEMEQRTIPLGRLVVITREGTQEARRELLVVARERRLAVGLDALHPGLRAARSVAFELSGIRQDRAFLTPRGERTLEGPLPRARRDFVQGTVALGRSGVLAYPLNASPREGWSAAVRLRARREVARPEGAAGVPGRDGSFEDAVGVLRGFLPLGDEGLTGEPGSAPVLAVRLAAGTARGPGAGSAHFRVGGTGDLLLPVRGVPAGTAGGRSAWGGSIELRTPLARLHRGHGTLPLHLDQIAGTVFLDWGGAGAVDTPFRHAASIGAELVLRQTVLFHGTESVRVGVAAPLSGGSGLQFHAALGWAF